MPRLRYLASFLFPVLTWLAIDRGGVWAFSSPLLAFGLVPLLELALPVDVVNLSADQESRARGERFYDALLYALVGMQWALVLFFLYKLSTTSLSAWHLAGAVTSLGLCCGAFGINVGHELGHRARKGEQRLAIAALISSLYVHFFIEHNRGHHARAATPEDPASARSGELLYAFWWRSIRDGLRSSWELEARRLARKGRGPWTSENQTLRLLLLQAAVLLSIFPAFGAFAGAMFMVSALLGALLLETVNYVEHYGLRRARREDGRYERVAPVHSWNSDHLLGRVLLFELTRHSDHHANPGRHYPVLRHFDESPQLPTGYPGMMILACVPPLFFRVMDPRVARFQAQQAA